MDCDRAGGGCKVELKCGQFYDWFNGINLARVGLFLVNFLMAVSSQHIVFLSGGLLACQC